jgi:hypothetical protein
MPINTARGDSRVWWPNRWGSTNWPNKGSPTMNTAAVSTSLPPPGLYHPGKRDREGGRQNNADIGDEPQDRRQGAPQDGARSSNCP